MRFIALAALAAARRELPVLDDVEANRVGDVASETAWCAGTPWPEAGADARRVVVVLRGEAFRTRRTEYSNDDVEAPPCSRAGKRWIRPQLKAARGIVDQIIVPLERRGLDVTVLAAGRGAVVEGGSRPRRRVPRGYSEGESVGPRRREKNNGTARRRRQIPNANGSAKFTTYSAGAASSSRRRGSRATKARASATLSRRCSRSIGPSTESCCGASTRCPWLQKTEVPRWRNMSTRRPSTRPSIWS